MQVGERGDRYDDISAPLPATGGSTIADLVAGKERMKIQITRAGSTEPNVINLEVRRKDPRGFFSQHKWVQLNVIFKGQQAPVWVKVTDLANELHCRPESIKKAAAAHELEHWVRVAQPYEQMKKQFHLTGALSKEQIRTICKIIQSGTAQTEAKKFFSAVHIPSPVTSQSKEASSSQPAAAKAPAPDGAEPVYIHKPPDLPVDIRVHNDNKVVVCLSGSTKGRLGQGSYKMVSIGVDFPTTQPVAAALPKTRQQFNKEHEDDHTKMDSTINQSKDQRLDAHAKTAQDDLRMEAGFLNQFQDIDQVVRIVNYFTVDGGHGMDLEYCNLGNLHRHCAGIASDLWEIPLSYGERLDVFRDVLLGLSKLHKRGVIHCDIKPGNILLKSEEDPSGERIVRGKIADFGKMIKPGEEHKGGTIRYMSPEIMGNEQQITPAIDAWAVGLMGLELFYGMDEVNECTTSKGELDYEKLKAKLPELEKRGLVGQCLSRLLKADPTKRMTTDQAYQQLTKIIAGVKSGALPIYLVI